MHLENFAVEQMKKHSYYDILKTFTGLLKKCTEFRLQRIEFRSPFYIYRNKGPNFTIGNGLLAQYVELTAYSPAGCSFVFCYYTKFISRLVKEK